MERYWCLRWLQQEKIGQVAGYLPPACVVGASAPYNHGVPLAGATGEGANESLRELIVTATVLRENLVKLGDIPLIFRVPSLPELPGDTRVQLAIGKIDLLDLEVQTRFVAKLEEVA